MNAFRLAALPLALAAADVAAREAFTIERVTFASGGETVVGNLYVPRGVDGTHSAPGVVVTGAWMTIKEQMAGRYARELAERGVVALAFDFRTWGESGGSPRSMEDPALKIADIGAAARFLAARPEVRDDAVSGLGICASAGYMAQAAVDEPTLRRVALVAPWLHDATIVDAVYGGAEGVEALIDAGRAAATRWRETGEATLRPAASSTDRNAVMFGAPYYTEPQRGLVPQWENTFNVASWEPWLRFDAIAIAPKLRQPVLVVHSEAAAIPQGARAFVAALPGKPREVWLDGVTQFDFYDADAPVRTAGTAVADFVGGASTIPMNDAAATR